MNEDIEALRVELAKLYLTCRQIVDKTKISQKRVHLVDANVSLLMALNSLEKAKNATNDR